jgi:hypothetical protein
LTENTDQQQTFTSTVCTEEGEPLIVLEDVLFRKVLPEQIQKALAANRADDDQRVYAPAWEPAVTVPALPDSFVVVGTSKETKAIAKALGKPCVADPAGDEQALVCIAEGAAERSVHAAVRLLQAAQKAATPPKLWFVTKGATGPSVTDPTHAGLWGLARTARQETGMSITLVDVDPSAPVASQLSALGEGGESMESELVVRSGKVYARRLLEIDDAPPDPPLALSAGSYIVTGGVGALGLVFAKWIADVGVPQAAQTTFDLTVVLCSRTACRRRMLHPRFQIYGRFLASRSSLRSATLPTKRLSMR